MIDFTNYTPSPSKEAAAVPGVIGEVGRNNFTDMMQHMFPGVMSSALLSLLLLIAFIIGLPLVIWLLQNGRIKNG